MRFSFFISESFFLDFHHFRRNCSSKMVPLVACICTNACHIGYTRRSTVGANAFHFSLPNSTYNNTNKAVLLKNVVFVQKSTFFTFLAWLNHLLLFLCVHTGHDETNAVGAFQRATFLVQLDSCTYFHCICWTTCLRLERVI